MNHYLYILPFKDKKHFKIGISSKSFNRVFVHNKTYEIDFKGSLVYTSKRATIKSLEMLLLSTTTQIETFIGKDGHTEVRCIQELNSCFDILKDFESKDLIKKHSFLKVQNEPFIIPKPVKRPVKKIPIVEGTNDEVTIQRCKESKSFLKKAGGNEEEIVRDFINYLLLDKDKVHNLYSNYHMGVRNATLSASVERLTGNLSDTEILDNLLNDIELFTAIVTERTKEAFITEKKKREEVAWANFKKVDSMI